jgi:hypothetical protein
MATNLETYGDLKKVIKIISLKQKGEKIGQVAIDAILGSIPGIGAAKTTFDFIKAAFSRPDSKKTKTWLDKIDVDDEFSAIVDDTIENNFLKIISQTIESESDDKPLEQDFNMNQKLVNHLEDKYKGRTLTGIKENIMKTQQLKYFIREEISKIIKEETAPVLKGDTSTLVNNFKKLNIPGFDPGKITTTIMLVKQNKVLNTAANKVLADIMTAMIKTSDDALLAKIFSNLKNIEAPNPE